MTGFEGTLSALPPTEIPELGQWLERVRGPAAVPRGLEEYRRSAELGLLFAVRGRQGLLAVSGLFVLADGRHHELGGTFVAEPLRGLGLQGLFFEVRFAAALALLPEDSVVLTAVQRDNPRSIRNARAAGFVDWPSPPECVWAPCRTCSGRLRAAPALCCCEVFLLPRPALLGRAAALYRHPTPVVLWAKDGRRLELRLQLPELINARARARIAGT